MCECVCVCVCGGGGRVWVGIPAVMVLVMSDEEKPSVGDVTCEDGEMGELGEGATLSDDIEAEEGKVMAVGVASPDIFLFFVGRIVVWIMFLNLPTVGSTSSVSECVSDE